LELEALQTLAELYQHLKTEITNIQMTFRAYTDSQVVLYWVKNGAKKMPQYVKKRVENITNIISPTNIYYVHTKENPADHASRGLSAEELADCSIWFTGPSWLQKTTLPSSTVHISPEINAESFLTQDSKEEKG
jgi:hypothetical protein